MSSVRKVFVALLLVMVASGAAFATDVTFQVNMSFQETLGTFNPAEDMVVVRGTFNEWGGNAEEVTDQGDGIYAGTFDITPGDHNYKFVIVAAGGDSWEDIDDRAVTVGDEAMTLDLVWFENQEPVEQTSVELLFQVDMQVQILNGTFDPENHQVVVRGSHPSIGDWGGAVAVLERETGSDVYSAWIEFADVAIGTAIEYKYVIVPDAGDDVWESSPNRSFTPTGEEEDSDENGFGEIVTDVVYFANVSADDILTSDLMVHFLVNVRPAFYKLADPDSSIIDVQTQDEITEITEVNVAGFFNNWPWGGFDAEHILADDGAGVDETAGDTIYSKDVQFFAGDPKELIFKFGLNGYDVEAGVEANHRVMLDVETAPYVIYAVFGTNGTLYDPYLGLVSVDPQENNTMPERFSLDQNYPNPFNPTTTVGFSLPEAGEFMLTVFNVNGQVVSLENLGHMQAGQYTATIDGSKLSSGTYFYTLQGNGYIATRKMTLLK
ncbi:T9SS type A sorting domain-containing protein [bacterium]|nr:T9SS type A sorting domain-containing protein [bacterium]